MLTVQGKQFNRLHSGTQFELMCVAHNIKRGLPIRQAVVPKKWE
jgi:hypothetical protein